MRTLPSPVCNFQALFELAPFLPDSGERGTGVAPVPHTGPLSFSPCVAPAPQCVSPLTGKFTCRLAFTGTAPRSGLAYGLQEEGH